MAGTNWGSPEGEDLVRPEQQPSETSLAPSPLLDVPVQEPGASTAFSARPQPRMPPRSPLPGALGACHSLRVRMALRIRCVVRCARSWSLRRIFKKVLKQLIGHLLRRPRRRGRLLHLSLLLVVRRKP